MITLTAFGQHFYLGQDLSYVNQMEDCGAVFKEGGVEKDVFRIFADQGTNLVRVRLWIDPSWQHSLEQPAGVKAQYSDFEDVKQIIARAKAAGMKVLLGIHYSDVWADPGRQLIPDRWLHLANDTEALKQAVYDYTVGVLRTLDGEGLMPDIVKVGNENNSGILYHTTMDADFNAGGSVSNDWSRHAQLYNAAIRGVRDVGATASVNPAITLHYSGLEGLKSWYSRIIQYGVTDFDIIGFSYYYSWHEGSIAALGTTIRDLVASFPQYQTMVVETGYLWTTENHDASTNIINSPDPEYLPVSPEKQLEYMVDYTREVMRAGGIGVVVWEPAWVSTPCTTPWGQGSAQDHAVFFDPVNNNFMENGGGKWTNPHFYQDLSTVKATFKVDMKGVEADSGVYVTGDFDGAEWQIRPMLDEGYGIYSYFTYLKPGEQGAYHFLNDDDWAARETVPAECATMWDTDRGYSMPDHDVKFAFKWASCEVAEEPVIGGVNGTFLVDMSASGQDLSKGVFLVGDMTDWTFKPLTAGANDIYSTSVPLTAGDELVYYYTTSNSWDNYEAYRETVPAECAYGSDRYLVVAAGDTTLGYKWSSCERVEPQTVEVTFRVDMQGQDDSRGVYVTGDFTAPNSGDSWQIVPMTHEGNQRYSYTTSLAPGTEGAYYFLNGNDWAARETVPAECATMWGTDRGYLVPENNVTYGFYWASCEAIPEVPATVEVTFKVDMQGQDDSRGAFITGDFSAPEAGASWQILPMTHEGKQIWSYTISMAPGSEGAYYFLNDNDWAARETVPAECATMYETDRGYLIPDHDLTYQFPWASCGGEDAAMARLKEDDAIFLVQEEKTENIQLYPNPSQGFVLLELPQFDHPVSLEVLDYTGKTVLKMENRQPDPAGKLHIGLDSLKPGFYLLKASDDGREFIYFRFKKNP